MTRSARSIDRSANGVLGLGALVGLAGFECCAAARFDAGLGLAMASRLLAGPRRGDKLAGFGPGLGRGGMGVHKLLCHYRKAHPRISTLLPFGQIPGFRISLVSTPNGRVLFLSIYTTTHYSTHSSPAPKHGTPIAVE